MSNDVTPEICECDSVRCRMEQSALPTTRTPACSLASLATPFVESPSPHAVSCGGRRCRSRMRAEHYEIGAIYLTLVRDRSKARAYRMSETATHHTSAPS